MNLIICVSRLTLFGPLVAGLHSLQHIVPLYMYKSILLYLQPMLPGLVS